MKPRLYSYAAIVLASAVLVFSCKKGDTGPAGPAGPAGANGTAGAAGPKGDTGTANVIYSAWTDVAFQPVTTPDTVVQGRLDTLYYVGAIVAPKLTANIISKGQILVYLNAGSAADPFIYPLPYTDILFAGLTIQVNYVVDSIYLAANFNASTQTVSGVKVQQYRYVITPGSVPASADKKDYNSIKNYFKLPD
ncbi:MAG TPA: hypothetical protein VL727_20765 [Puia sp.]|jgi:hypothetical protein|nr:hypothetical protein [Puia sp.]